MTPDPAKVDPGILAAAGAAPSVDAPAAPGAPIAAPAVTSWRAEALSIWQCVASLGHVFPSVKPIYTPEVLDQLADAWAPILERHKLPFANFLVYFVAAGATIPVGVATYQAVRADSRAMKAGRVKPAAAADERAPDAPAPAPGPIAEPDAGGSGDDAAKPNVPLDPGGPIQAPARPV